MLKVQIKTDLKCDNPIDNILEKYHISKNELLDFQILHRSIDLRTNQKPHYLYTVSLNLKDQNKYLKRYKDFQNYTKQEYIPPRQGNEQLDKPIVIVGFGPSGMASALFLARQGYKPIIFEKGSDIVTRKMIVDNYWNGDKLNLETNVQFGEGGAGAFSDGKLTTRIKDSRVPLILKNLVKLGADQSIEYVNHPHLGTDTLYNINQNIRKEIESLGGEIHFNSSLQDIIVENKEIKGIIVNNKRIDCKALILCIGHSAIDTIEMLSNKGLLMENKPFAVGYRIEHLQEYINNIQYRNIEKDIKLPNAEYYLTHTSSIGKGVYSFCMCPGGYVVPSESQLNTIVTNGMSYHARDGINANSALLVQVDSSDYGTDLFAGLKFQKELEDKAFILGNGKAPCEYVSDYLKNEKDNTVLPTYKRGVTFTDLHQLLPVKLDNSLREMLINTEKKLPGFTENAILTGVESKSSCPIRILRDNITLQSNIKGIYPCGEGSGYSGGIVSSAIDGIKCAEKITEIYSSQ